jgi:hypothetical protein
MKATSSFLFLILITNQIIGQLSINAGKDTIVCISLWGVDTTYLGGDPTVIGGEEPYTYAWSAEDTILSMTFWASFFLDDTTLANPRLIESAGHKLKFYIDVWDNLGNHERDSISVRFSQFGYLLMDDFAIINQGETARLWCSIGGGIPPLNFSWSPNYNISDTSIAEPLAWPDISTNYTLNVTDSIGCVAMPEVFEVIVNPVDIIQQTIESFKSEVIPNPIDINSVIKLNTVYQNNLNIRIFNESGQVILYDNIKSDSYKIGEKINSNGIYTYIIFDSSKILTSGKFIKR